MQHNERLENWSFLCLDIYAKGEIMHQTQNLKNQLYLKDVRMNTLGNTKVPLGPVSHFQQ